MDVVDRLGLASFLGAVGAVVLLTVFQAETPTSADVDVAWVPPGAWVGIDLQECMQRSIQESLGIGQDQNQKELEATNRSLLIWTALCSMATVAMFFVMVGPKLYRLWRRVVPKKYEPFIC